MSNMDNKKDIRYTIFVTSTMDDKVEQVSRMMGLSKPEVVRFFIAQGCMGLTAATDMLNAHADDLIAKIDNNKCGKDGATNS